MTAIGADIYLATCVLLALAMGCVFAVGFFRRRYAAQLVLVFLCAYVACWLAGEGKWVPAAVSIPVTWSAGFILAVGLFIVWNSESQR